MICRACDIIAVKFNVMKSGAIIISSGVSSKVVIHEKLYSRKWGHSDYKGITVFKIVIWGCKSLVLWSEISFYGNTSAEP